jgi:hypothetical protein
MLGSTKHHVCMSVWVSCQARPHLRSVNMSTHHIMCAQLSTADQHGSIQGACHIRQCCITRCVPYTHTSCVCAPYVLRVIMQKYSQHNRSKLIHQALWACSPSPPMRCVLPLPLPSCQVEVTPTGGGHEPGQQQWSAAGWHTCRQQRVRDVMV